MFFVAKLVNMLEVAPEKIQGTLPGEVHTQNKISSRQPQEKAWDSPGPISRLTWP